MVDGAKVVITGDADSKVKEVEDRAVVGEVEDRDRDRAVVVENSLDGVSDRAVVGENSPDGVSDLDGIAKDNGSKPWVNLFAEN